MKTTSYEINAYWSLRDVWTHFIIRHAVILPRMTGSKKDLGSEVTANVLVSSDSGDEGGEKEGT